MNPTVNTFIEEVFVAAFWKSADYKIGTQMSSACSKGKA